MAFGAKRWFASTVAAATLAGRADAVYTNAKVVTVDDRSSIAQAVAVKAVALQAQRGTRSRQTDALRSRPILAECCSGGDPPNADQGRRR